MNLKDLPAEAVRPLGVEVTHPDQFIVAQWDLYQLVAIAAFKRMRARWSNPQGTPEDFAAASSEADCLRQPSDFVMRSSQSGQQWPGSQDTERWSCSDQRNTHARAPKAAWFPKKSSATSSMRGAEKHE